jgi:endonuclease/exonuclease/phosphatase family metal-dependent hydrolase
MKKFLKTIMWIIITAILIFAGFLLYITIVDYVPDQVESLMETNKEVQPLELDTLNLMSWNIGYAGLGAEMDFFYDDGKKVRPTEEMSRKYLDGIKQFIRQTDSVDFWLFQEVDFEARRSHYNDEVREIAALKPESNYVFAKNYDVPFVPVPLYEPLGFVKGGMMSFSEFPFTEASRYAYPLIASWPNKLFLLDRCFILLRFPLTSGKDLLVLNTHNSAYVYDSALRIKELNIIKDKMLEEYEKGNYVVAGGDWNANPPNFVPINNYSGHRFVPSEVVMKENIFPGDWTWAFDASAPTNRQNYKSFVKGENGTTILDYFIVSPNVELLQATSIDLEFENSDHNPVFVKVALK